MFERGRQELGYASEECYNDFSDSIPLNYDAESAKKIAENDMASILSESLLLWVGNPIYISKIRQQLLIYEVEIDSYPWQMSSVSFIECLNHLNSIHIVCFDKMRYS